MKRFILALVLGVCMNFASAAPVTYVIQGDLSLNAGLDIYNLDGASYIWRINADTASSPIGGNTQTGHYQWVSSDMLIVNRPNNLPNINGEILGRNTNNFDLTTKNIDQDISSSPDTPLNIFGGWFPLMGANFIVGGAIINAPSDYFPGSGVAPLPDDLSMSDLTNFFSFAWGCNGCGDQYLTSNFSINTVVPIPAAVWLFGSALGLLGWMRRKRT